MISEEVKLSQKNIEFLIDYISGSFTREYIYDEFGNMIGWNDSTGYKRRYKDGLIYDTDRDGNVRVFKKCTT